MFCIYMLRFKRVFTERIICSLVGDVFVKTFMCEQCDVRVVKTLVFYHNFNCTLVCVGDSVI